MPQMDDYPDIELPTVNASRNVWGTILNAALNAIGAVIKAVEEAGAAALAAAVSALEASIADIYLGTPLGYATGLYVFPPSVAGYTTETASIVAGSQYAIWFPYAGRFDGVGWYGGIIENAEVKLYGATETGDVDVVGGALATATYGGSSSGTAAERFIAFNSGAIDLSRGCWIVMIGGTYTCYGRGRAELSERDFSLGCTTLNPTTAAHAPSSLISTDGLNFSANSFTLSGYGPGVALRTAA